MKLGDFQIGGNRRQRIIEIMGEASGQPADGLEALRLGKLVLDLISALHFPLYVGGALGHSLFELRIRSRQCFLGFLARGNIAAGPAVTFEATCFVELRLTADRDPYRAAPIIRLGQLEIAKCLMPIELSTMPHPLLLADTGGRHLPYGFANTRIRAPTRALLHSG